MTKKDYVAIAKGLHDRLSTMRIATSVNPECVAGFACAVMSVCESFKADNPRFDEARFMVAVFGADWQKVYQ